jgi:hypothetical protein
MSPLALLAVFVSVVTPGALIVSAYTLRPLQRQRNLVRWGEPVPAVVAWVTRTKSGQQIHYEFLDQQGNRVVGQEQTVSFNAPGPGSIITILVDSTKSSRSTPYPPPLVLLGQ